jgi:hypothetical protein
MFDVLPSAATLQRPIRTSFETRGPVLDRSMGSGGHDGGLTQAIDSGGRFEDLKLPRRHVAHKQGVGQLRRPM